MAWTIALPRFGNGLGGAPPLGQSSIWPRDGDGPNLRPWSSPQPMPGSDPLAPMPDPVPQPVPESTQHDPSQLEQPRSQWWYLDPQTQAVQGPTSARVLVSWARSGTLPMSTLVASVDPRPVPGAPASPDNDAPLWQSLAQLVEAFGGDNGDGGEGGLSIPNPPVWQASGPEQTPDDAPVSEQALTPPGFEDASSASGVDQSSEENFGVQGSPGTSDYGQLSSDAQPVDEQTKGEATDVTAPELTEGVVGYGHPPPEMEVESKEEKLLGEPEGDPSATPEALAMHSNNAVATNPWQLPSEAQEINAGATVPMESLDTKESMEQQPSMAPVVDSSPAAPLTAADLYASYYRLSDDDDDDDGQSSSSTTARSSNNDERDLAAGTTRSERPQEHGAIDAFPDDDYLGDEYRSRKAEESSPVEAVPNEIGALQETKIAATLVETKEVATGAESFQAIATEEELPIEATPVVEEQAPSYEAVHVAESAPLEATAVEDSDMQFDSDTVNEAWNLEKDKKEQGDSDDFVPSDSQGIEEFEGGKVNEGSEGLPEASDSAAVNATSQPDSATAATDSTGAGAPSMPRAVWSERGSSLEGPHGSFEQRQVVLSLPKSLAMVVTTMKLTANQNSAVDGPEECSAEGSAEGSANEWHDKTAAAHSSTASNLPPGWQMLSDSTGRPYYANAATRESSYDPPPPAGASPTDSPSNYPLNAQQQTPPFQQHYSQAQEQAQPQQQQSLPNQEGYRYSPNDMYQQRATEQQNYGQMPQSYGAATNPYGNDPYAPYGAASYGAAPYGPPLPQPVSPYGAAPYSSFPQGPGAYRSSSARSLGSSMGPSSGLSFGRMAAGFLGAAGGRKLTFVARSTMSTVGGRTGAVFSMVRGALPIPSKSTDASSSSNAPSDTSASSPPIEDDDTDAAPLPDDDDDMDVPLSEGPRQWIEGDILSRQPPQPPPSSSEAQMLPSRQPLPPLMPPPPLQPKPKVMRPAPSGASSSSSSVLAAPGSLMKWTLNQGVQWALPGLRPLYQLAPHALMHAFKAAPAAVLLLPLLRSLAAVLHTLLPVLTVFAFAGVLPLPEAAAGTNAATVAATAKTTAENMCRWLASVSPFINQPWLLHGSDGSGRGSAADAPLALVPLAHVVALPAVVIACVALVATIANAAANALARRMHTKTEQAISARLASARADIDAVNLLNAVGPGAAESTREEAGSLMKGGKRKRSAHRWANEPSDEALLGDSAAAFHVAEAVDALAKGVAAAAAVVVAAGAVAWVARILSVTAAPGESVGEGALSAGEMLREALSTVGEASKGVGQQMSQAAGCALESGGHMLKQVPSWGWRPGEDVFSDDHGLEEALFGASGLGDDVEDAVASSVESGSGALSSSSSGSCHRLIASMSGSLLRVWPKLLITAWVVAVVVESLLLPSPPPSKAVPPVKTSPIYATGSKGSGSGAGDENEALEAAATGLVAMKRYKRRPFMDQSLTSTGSHRHSQEPQRRGPGVVMQAVHSAQHTVGASVAIVWRLLLSLVLTAADSTVIAAAVHAVATLCVGYSRTLAATKGPSSHPTSGFSMVGLELVQRIGLVGCSALLLRRGHMAVREAGQVIPF